MLKIITGVTFSENIRLDMFNSYSVFCRLEVNIVTMSREAQGMKKVIELLSICIAGVGILYG